MQKRERSLGLGVWVGRDSAEKLKSGREVEMILVFLTQFIGQTFPHSFSGTNVLTRPRMPPPHQEDAQRSKEEADQKRLNDELLAEQKKDMNCIAVTNLNYDVKIYDLTKLFHQFGDVVEVVMTRGPSNLSLR